MLYSSSVILADGTTLDLLSVEDQHKSTAYGSTCRTCRSEWPCDAFLLLRALLTTGEQASRDHTNVRDAAASLVFQCLDEVRKRPEWSNEERDVIAIATAAAEVALSTSSIKIHRHPSAYGRNHENTD